MSGKRVVLRGLPFGIPISTIKELSKGINVVEGSEAIKALPPYVRLAFSLRGQFVHS